MSNRGFDSFPGQFFRIDKAAETLGVSRRTLYRIVDEKHLVIIKVRGCSCISSQQLQDYMKRQMGGQTT